MFEILTLDDDPRDRPVPTEPAVEEPDSAPPPREEPGTGEPTPSDSPVIG